jgi:GST-like protein
MYLAEKMGRFMPVDMVPRYLVIQWLMFQMGSIGPMFGQAHHFRHYAADDLSYSIDRYTNETGRLYRVMEHRLGEAEYLAGEYSIADMAVFPWTRGYERQGQSLDDLPNVKRWFEAISARPTVERGLAVLAERRRENWHKDKEAFSIMFGKKQYARR